MERPQRTGGRVDGTSDFEAARGLEHVDRLGEDVADKCVRDGIDAGSANDAAGDVVVDLTRSLGRAGRWNGKPAGIDFDVEDVVPGLERTCEFVREGQIPAL